MITVVVGKEIEKIKGDYESFLNSWNMVGGITYSQYSKLYDEGTKQIQKAYELGKSELEKENAELKEQNRSYEQLIDKGSVTLAQERLKNYKKLTEAKDLIRNLLRVTYGEGWNYSLDWKVKAEAFLKEE